MTLPTDPLLGVVLSAIGATTWALHYLFVRMGMREGTVTRAVYVALLSNVVLVVPVGVALNYPDLGLSPGAVVAFVFAGLCGGLLARVFQYRSIELIGASRTSPIVASAGLVSTVLAVLILGETLTVVHGVGIVMIVAGVAMTSWETARDRTASTTVSLSESISRSRGSLAPFALPLLAATFYGVEPVLIAIGLEHGTPILVGMGVMIVAATVGYVGYYGVYGSLSVRTVVFDSAFPWYVAAGLAGTASFLLYFAALAVSPVVIVIPIFQTVPLIVLVLSVLFMPRRLERVTTRLIVAATVVVVGATLVSLSA